MSPVSHQARRFRTAGLVLAAGFARAARAQAPAEPALAQEVVVSGARPARDATDVKLAAAQARREPGTQGDPVKVIESLPGVGVPRSAPASSCSGEQRRKTHESSWTVYKFHSFSTAAAFAPRSTAIYCKACRSLPGAYGADYGRGIGGLVRLETRDLPRVGSHAVVDLNTLDGAALVSAAPSERVRFAVAFRYGWLDRVLNAVSAPDVGEFFAVPSLPRLPGQGADRASRSGITRSGSARIER
ncbi:MAG: hypothetical protein WDO74_08850 [Pseudomonadota bacterium]